MHHLVARVSGRRSGEDGVGKFEENVAPAAGAFVERAAEANIGGVRFGWTNETDQQNVWDTA